MATLVERYWQELRPSAAVVRQGQAVELAGPVRRRPRRGRRERDRVLVRRGR